MEYKTAYQKMLEKKSIMPKLSLSERKINAEITIQAMRGLGNHSRDDLIKEFNIVRRGNVDE